MKIAADVLAVLSALSIDGREVRIAEQLERRLYQRVNEVLEACGGKWNRKAKAHLFPEDAAPLLDAVINLGEVTTSKDVGFFPTPAPLARELVELAGVQRGDVVLEPSAGTGRIVDAALEAGARRVVAIERDHKMAASLMARGDARVIVPPYHDFLDADAAIGPIDRAPMNPPFCRVGRGDHLDHVRHAFAMLRPGGVLVSVLPSSITFRRDRRHAAFRDWFATLGGRVKELPAFSFRESGTDVNTVVLRMEAR